MTEVAWLGHSTVTIRTGGLTILTDPVLRSTIGPLRRCAPLVLPEATPDVILISHLHHDHLDRPSLARLDRSATLVVPAGARSLVERLGFREVHEVDAADRIVIRGVGLRAVPARHGGGRLPLIGPVAPALGYIVEGEHRVYFAGDTDLFPGMAELDTDLDMALLPVGGWGPTLRGGHLDPARAARATVLIRPRMVVPVHWGTYWPVGMGRVRRARFGAPGEQLRTEVERIAPFVRVVVADHGEPVGLT